MLIIWSYEKTDTQYRFTVVGVKRLQICTTAFVIYRKIFIRDKKHSPKTNAVDKRNSSSDSFWSSVKQQKKHLSPTKHNYKLPFYFMFTREKTEWKTYSIPIIIRIKDLRDRFMKVYRFLRNEEPMK